ncbi:hypothetical protein VIBNISFn118_1050040 [Vibrio nigripulchritudo SFn118]|nr:hypothetical protein VIBNISFn118_1050040 [Vibrio nigripulchritudo SFn118]
MSLVNALQDFRTSFSSVRLFVLLSKSPSVKPSSAKLLVLKINALVNIKYFVTFISLPLREQDNQCTFDTSNKSVSPCKYG